MIIPGIKPFDGQHCETTATGTLLLQQGIVLPEPLLFGLGEGLGFIFWNMKSIPMPFIGGRVKPDVLTERLAANLGLTLTVNETASPVKAWAGVKTLLDEGQVVGLKLDCFYLDYFSRPFHFAGHYVAIYGYDETYAYLVDTRQQGGFVKTKLENLAAARAAKGPMASKSRYYTIGQRQQHVDLAAAIRTAIYRNASDFLNPPITNIGYKGIAKTGAAMVRWFKQSKTRRTDFHTTAELMEKAGTGGALFRNLYCDFLQLSKTYLPQPALQEAHGLFTQSAEQWTAVSGLFEQASVHDDITFVQEAAELLQQISRTEKEAMEMLLTLQ
jgi:hypothetical protein